MHPSFGIETLKCRLYNLQSPYRKGRFLNSYASFSHSSHPSISYYSHCFYACHDTPREIENYHLPRIYIMKFPSAVLLAVIGAFTLSGAIPAQPSVNPAASNGEKVSDNKKTSCVLRVLTGYDRVSKLLPMPPRQCPLQRQEMVRLFFSNRD